MNKAHTQDLPFWYFTKDIKPKRLTHSFKTDVVIVGGGMAGISAAQSFRKKGQSVVLLEKHFCGSGATGKSTGFITPDSELDLNHFNRKYGPVRAKQLWEFGMAGSQRIENNIKTYNLTCDYRVQDTLIVANSCRAYKELEEESIIRKQVNYASTLYDDKTIANIIGSTDYYGGIRYGGSFGINPFLYIQGMKDVLIEKGVDVYEEAPVTAVKANSVEVQGVEIQADHIVVCADYATTELGKLNHEVYHVQTFVMASSPLTDAQVHQIFPQEPCMVWDTDLVYQYYRLVQENRLVLGGASMFSTYFPYAQHDDLSIQRKLINYIERKFPQVKFNFQYMWPGLIGVSKDIVPVAGFDPEIPSIYYVAGTAGLPWAAALGNYSAERIVDNNSTMDDFFLPTRPYPLPKFLQYIVGKPITFALSNFISLEMQ
ncbi:MAG: FAD-binding oxidoreductase [Candidatus Dependentiae bacterium]|nr:FAD-binding oxidoreductase [Candidatus Dependentiae bacterium]